MSVRTTPQRTAEWIPKYRPYQCARNWREKKKTNILDNMGAAPKAAQRVLCVYWHPDKGDRKKERSAVILPVFILTGGVAVSIINIKLHGSYTFWPMDFSRTLNQIPMTKLISQYKHEQFRKCCACRLIFWASFFKKHINYFKLCVNKHVIITNFHDFSKTFMI